MQPEELVARHPKLYHMAQAGSWPIIQEYGLLSTTALLDLFGFEKGSEQRVAIESAHRSECVRIEHPQYGEALIRDQIPLNMKKLERCLHGVTPVEWLQTLNRKVFFWLSKERLHTLLGAKAYKDRAHTVIVVDTQALLQWHLDRVTLSPINSGSTLYDPTERGSDTFRALADFPLDWWRRHRVKELAVDYSVPDISELAISVEEWQGDQLLCVLFRK